MNNDSNSEKSSLSYDIGRKACLALIVLSWLLIIGGLAAFLGFLFAILKAGLLSVVMGIATALSVVFGGVGSLAAAYVGLAIIDNTLTNMRILEKLSEKGADKA